MDPKNPGQAPGEPTPPLWGPPPNPEQQGYDAQPSPWGVPPSQQGYGAPPNPDQPGYGNPPPPPDQPYGNPPPPPDQPYGNPPPPPDQPYGAPQYPYAPPQGQYGGPPPSWGVPAPTSRPSKLPRIIGALVVVIVLVAAGLFVYSMTTGRSGKVVFSTDVPATGTHTGCTIDHQVTTIDAATPVYATYIFGSTLGTEAISISVTKDGQTFIPATAVSTADTNGIDCFSDTTDLSQLPNWGPGTYHFAATSSGTTEAEGDLTVR